MVINIVLIIIRLVLELGYPSKVNVSFTVNIATISFGKRTE